jgi:CelD/BcsL family acetyltransferase involved in cellulose biosynthesis
LVTSKLVTTFDEFLKLEHAWNELVDNSEVNHASMKHQWFAEFIKAYQLQDSLSIVTVWVDGQLAAIAPIHRRPLVFRKIGAKGLGFLASDLGLRMSFITADSSLVSELVKQLLQLDDWDVFVAENMNTEFDTTRKFLELFDSKLAKYNYQIARGFQSPYLTTEGSWEEYWSQLPSKRRNYLKNMCLRRLQEADSYEINQITTPEAFKAFAPSMFQISRKSWKANSGDSFSFDSPQGQLYMNFTPYGLEHKWVAIYTIRINKRLIGFEYMFRCVNKYLVLKCDYDEEYSYYSPGNNLRIAIVKALFDKQEPCEYDMGGDDDLYKRQWCRNVRGHITIMVGNRNIKGGLVMFAKNTALPFLRNLKGTLRNNIGAEKG